MARQISGLEGCSSLGRLRNLQERPAMPRHERKRCGEFIYPAVRLLDMHGGEPPEGRHPHFFKCRDPGSCAVLAAYFERRNLFKPSAMDWNAFFRSSAVGESK